MIALTEDSESLGQRNNTPTPTNEVKSHHPADKAVSGRLAYLTLVEQLAAHG